MQKYTLEKIAMGDTAITNPRKRDTFKLISIQENVSIIFQFE